MARWGGKKKIKRHRILFVHQLLKNDKLAFYHNTIDDLGLLVLNGMNGRLAKK